MNLSAMELLQTVPPAPGRGETVQPSTPQAPPAGGEQAPPGGGFGSMGMMLLMFLPMVLVLLLLSRSQSKKQRELESKLKKGDRVVTAGGLIGRIIEISPQSKYVKLEITSGVKVEMLKTAIQGLDTGDVAAAAAKDAGKAKEETKK